MIKKYLIMLGLLASPLASQAMEFYKLFPCSDQSCSPYILANGPITPGTTNQFIAFFNKNPAPYVYFNSDGGDLNEGILLGETIHRAKLNTYVSNQPYKYAYPDKKEISYNTIGGIPSCSTACTVAFLGGIKHTLDNGAFLGAYNLNDFPNKKNTEALNTALKNFSSEIGMVREINSLFNKSESNNNPLYWFTDSDIFNYYLNNGDNPETGWNMKNSAEVTYPYAYNEISLFNTSQKVGVAFFYDHYRPYLTFTYILPNDNENKKFESYINNMTFDFNVIMDGKQYTTNNVQWHKNDDGNYQFTVELSPDFVQKLKNETGSISLNFSYPQRAEYFKPDVSFHTDSLYGIMMQTKI